MTQCLTPTGWKSMTSKSASTYSLGPTKPKHTMLMDKRMIFSRWTRKRRRILRLILSLSGRLPWKTKSWRCRRSWSQSCMSSKGTKPQRREIWERASSLLARKMKKKNKLVLVAMTKKRRKESRLPQVLLVLLLSLVLKSLKPIILRKNQRHW